MKTFIVACIAAAVIAIGAVVVLNSIQKPVETAFQLALKPCDPFLDPATISFQLCLARSAGSNSAGLTGKVMPHSR